VIKRRDSRAVCRVDFVEKLEQRGLLTFSCPAITLRRSGVAFGIFAITSRSRIVTFSRPAAISSRELDPDQDDVPDNSPDPDSPGAIPEYRLYVVEVLLPGQELALGVHEGDAAALGGHTADIDVAPGELADDDGRLVAGL
jgi:hypothetical protein